MVLLALILLGCPSPKLIPEEGWTLRDYIELEKARPGCRRLYGPKSCLIEFRKVGEREYYAICSNRK